MKEKAKLNIAFALILKSTNSDPYFIDCLFESATKDLKLLNDNQKVDYAAANYHRGRYLIENIENKKYSKLDKNRLMVAKKCF